MPQQFRVGLIVSLLSILVLGTTFAQDARVAYLEGLVEYQTARGWQPADIGTVIPAGARLRLHEDAYLEIVRNRTTVRFLDAGEFDLDTQQTGSAGSAPTNVSGLLLNRVGRLLGREQTAEQDSTVAGVRASEAAAQPEIEWLGDEDPQELISEGLMLLNEGEIEEASFRFEDAYDIATGAAYQEAGFYFAYSLSLLDEADFAREVLEETVPDPDADYFLDYTLVAAQLALADGDSRQAQRYLDAYIDAHADVEQLDPLAAQAIYYLRSQALRGRDARAADADLRRVVRLVPETELAQEAARELDE